MGTKKDELSSLINEIIGYASLCWKPRPTGIFDTTQALECSQIYTPKIRSLIISQLRGLLPDRIMNPVDDRLCSYDTYDEDIYMDGRNDCIDEISARIDKLEKGDL